MLEAAICTCGATWDVPNPVRDATVAERLQMLRNALSVSETLIAIPCAPHPHRPRHPGLGCNVAWVNVTYDEIADTSTLDDHVVRAAIPERHVAGHSIPAGWSCDDGTWSVSPAPGIAGGPFVEILVVSLVNFDHRPLLMYLDPSGADMFEVCRRVLAVLTEHGQLARELLENIHRPVRVGNARSFSTPLTEAIASVADALGGAVAA